MPTVTGDAVGLRSQARVWGVEAQAANSQATQLGHAASTIGVAQFRGPAGDRMRAFVSHLQTAAASVATAYGQLADAAPVVAEAIEHAQQAERKHDQAKTKVQTAQDELTTARDALTSALRAQTMATHVPGAVVAPAVHQAVSAAQGRVSRADAHLTDAQHALTAAQHDFETADHDRQRLSKAFADLTRRVSATVQHAAGAVPPAPNPAEVGGISPLVTRFTTLIGGAENLTTVAGGQLETVAKYGHKILESGSAGPAEKAFYASVQTWARRVASVEKFGGPAIAFTSAALESLTDPNLTPARQRVELVKKFALGTLGADAGGAGAAGVCAYSGVGDLALPLCRAGGSVVGGFLGEQLEKIKPLDDAANYTIGRGMAPLHKGLADFRQGLLDDDAKEKLNGELEILASPLKGTINIVSPAVGPVGHAVAGAGKSVWNAPGNFVSKLGHDLRWVPHP